jgi:hypothetical protein
MAFTQWGNYFIETLEDGSNGSLVKDGSVTPVDFESSGPAANEYWDIYTLELVLADGAGWNELNFAGHSSNLTNGLDLVVNDGTSDVLNITDAPITRTRQLLARPWDGRLMAVGAAEFFTAGNATLEAVIDFPKLFGGPLRIDGDDSEKLICRVNDDLTGTGAGLAVGTVIITGRGYTKGPDYDKQDGRVVPNVYGGGG